MPKRIGVFGGAFDPPHRAHRALVEAAMAQLSLDHFRVVPTGQAWHKPRQLSAPEHRIAMCRHAFADLMPVQVDAREIERQAPSYTIDTLSELHAEFPGANLFLMLGIDQWRAFTTWHRWQEILKLAVPVVALRPETPPPWPLRVRPRPPTDLDPRLPEPVWLHMPYLNVSSTEIRQACATLGPTSPLPVRDLHPAVAGYISQHQLYTQPDTP